MKDYFGRFGGDPGSAIRFRHECIEPFLRQSDTFTLDFAGMAGINSSCANALLANLVQQHSVAVLNKLCFVNCTPSVRALLHLATQIGQDRHSVKSLEVAA